MYTTSNSSNVGGIPSHIVDVTLECPDVLQSQVIGGLSWKGQQPKSEPQLAELIYITQRLTGTPTPLHIYDCGFPSHWKYCSCSRSRTQHDISREKQLGFLSGAVTRAGSRIRPSKPVVVLRIYPFNFSHSHDHTQMGCNKHATHTHTHHPYTLSLSLPLRMCAENQFPQSDHVPMLTLRKATGDQVWGAG